MVRLAKVLFPPAAAGVAFSLCGCGGGRRHDSWWTTTSAPAPGLTTPSTTTSAPRTTYVGDVEALGCPATAEEQLEHLPTGNFSVDDHLEHHGSFQAVACVVQGYDRVTWLRHAYYHWNTAPFAEECLAIGSSCGSPCSSTGGHSDACDPTTMTILPEYLYNEDALKNRSSGQGFSLRHRVSIGNRNASTGYPMHSCEPCRVECADPDWQQHCKMDGRTDSGTNCEDWKCIDPPDADDVPAHEPDPVPCRDRWECEHLAPHGLNIKDLFVQAELEENDIPPASRDSNLYFVIFAGVDLQRSVGMSQPRGRWMNIYMPRQNEPMSEVAPGPPSVVVA